MSEPEEELCEECEQYLSDCECDHWSSEEVVTNDRDRGCNLCEALIGPGWLAVHWTGRNQDGDYDEYVHVDCQAATVKWTDEEWDGHRGWPDTPDDEWPKYDKNGNVIPVEGGK